MLGRLSDAVDIHLHVVAELHTMHDVLHSLRATNNLALAVTRSVALLIEAQRCCHPRSQCAVILGAAWARRRR